MAMATAVPLGSSHSPQAPLNAVTEFLFIADFGSSTITSFRINGDGSLSLKSETPFVAGDAPRKVAALGGHLLAAGKSSLVVYGVDKDTGSLRQTDSVVLSPLHDFVVDAPASLIYAASGDEIFAYRLADALLQPLPGSPYPVSANPSAIRTASLMLDLSRNALQARLQMDRGPAGLVAVMPRNADGSLDPATSLPDLAVDNTTWSAIASRTPVLDATGRFAYLAGSGSAEVFAYRFEAGKLMSLSPASYHTGEKPVSIAVVAP